MKQVFFIVSAISLALLSCTKPASPDQVMASLEGTWRMMMVKDNASSLIITKPSSVSGEVEIIFTPSGTAGTFTGKTPTNDIWQNDYSTGANQSLTIPCLSMTKVAETTWGEEFVDNIRSAQLYNFESGGLLNIRTTNKTLTFKKL
jgi:hypothetical protein